MPGLINRVCPPQHRAVALGIWGAFIPAAMSLMLLISPAAMAQFGWRGLWQATALASILLAALFIGMTAGLARSQGMNASASDQPAHHGAMMVSLVFTGYSALFAAVTAFLPTYWAETRGVSIAAASHLASLVVIGNILGNVSAGFLVGRGVALTRLIRIALLGGGSCAALVFTGLMPLAGEVIAAWLFTFLAGLLPGAVFANIGLIAPTVRSVPLTTGMIFQGAGIGQVLGPLGIGAAAESGLGWLGGSLFLGAVCLSGLVLTVLLPSRFKLPNQPAG